jgi:hypothetical protein
MCRLSRLPQPAPRSPQDYQVPIWPHLLLLYGCWGGTIAWLSGAAVGIGAIFYVCGVLVTIANLDMLGLDPLIFRYDAAFYMHRGGLFLLEFATEAGQFFFQAIPLVGVLLLLAAPLRKHRTMSV